MQPTPRQLKIPGWFTRREFEAYDKAIQTFSPNKPQTFLEIGTHFGRSTSTYIPHLSRNPDWHLICVDNYSDFGCEYSLQALRHLHHMFAEHQLHHQVHFFHLSTRNPFARGGLTSLVQHLPARTLSLAFVDGSHTPHGVQQDIELVLPLLHPNHGVICGHDFRWNHGPNIRKGIENSPIPLEKVRNPADSFWIYP